MLSAWLLALPTGSVAYAQEAEGEASRADALVRRAESELEAGQPAAALASATEAVALFERTLGPDSAEVALALDAAGAAARHRGDLGGALPLFERSLAIREVALGPDHPGVATSLNNLASLRKAQGDLAGARPLFERSLAIREKAFGADDFGDARPLCERGLAILERALGADHPDVGSGLNAYASLLQAQGDLAGARPLYERSLAILERAHGPDHPMVAVALNNLAMLLEDAGDDAGARPLYERSLAVKEKAHGPDHPNVARGLLGLGGHLLHQGDLTGARPLLERGLAIGERALGFDHPMVAIGRNNLAVLLVALGDMAAAQTLYERSLAVLEGVLGPDHPEVARLLNNLGRLQQRLGNVAGARPLYERSLAIWEQAFGPGHPDVAQSLDNFVFLLNAEGDLAGARAAAARALAIRESRLDLLDALADREQLLFVAQSRPTLDAWLGMFDRAEDATDAWAAVLRWKGIGAAHQAATRSASRSDPALAELADRLDATRRELAALTWSDPTPQTQAARDARIAVLTADKESIERELAGASAAFRAGAAVAAAGPAEVCAALPEDARLVDVLESGGRYLAFVVGPGCDVVRVDLGPTADVDGALASLREVLASPAASTTRVDGRGVSVRRLAWDPLLPALGAAARVLVVPDGALSALPWAALPLDDGRYLLEDRAVSLLSRARDLVRLSAPAPEATGAVVVGGVDYGQAAAAAPALVAMRAAPCAEGDYPALPGTETERDAVAARWNDAHRRTPATVLAGTAATEDALAGAVADKRLVHLATHGFFATGACRSVLDDAEGKIGYSPMLLSGIVLAGANVEHPPGAPADGILTAEEVASLPLDGAQVVVLSACETGLGEVRSGEGVLGLQRAASVAGARSLVMSLWSVPDEATARLMDGFYEALLRRRHASGPADALREAQLALLAERRSHGEARPQDWAPFVATGAWEAAAP